MKLVETNKEGWVLLKKRSDHWEVVTERTKATHAGFMKQITLIGLIKKEYLVEDTIVTKGEFFRRLLL